MSFWASKYENTFKRVAALQGKTDFQERWRELEEPLKTGFSMFPGWDGPLDSDDKKVMKKALQALNHPPVRHEATSLQLILWLARGCQEDELQSKALTFLIARIRHRDREFSSVRWYAPRLPEDPKQRPQLEELPEELSEDAALQLWMPVLIEIGKTMTHSEMHRTRALRLATDSDPLLVVAMIDRIPIPPSLLVDTHATLIEEPLSPALEDALEHLYRHASWLGKRVMIQQLDDPRFSPLVPALVRIGRSTDSITRASILDALERIGHISAEPFLEEVLQHGPPGEQLVAARGLEKLGTRACVPALAHAIEHATFDGVRKQARSALDAINERYPVAAVAGSISLAETDHVAGALSLAGADEGAISLYESVRSEIAQGVTLADSQDTNLTQNEPGWVQIHAAPRSLPVGYHLETILLGKKGGALICWSTAAGLVWIPLLGIKSLLVGGLLLCGLASVFVHRRESIPLLRDGTPTFGELEEVEEFSPTSTRTMYRHRFNYLRQDGTLQSHELIAHSTQTHVTDDALEPMLYLGPHARLFDEIRGLSIAPDGSFRYARGRLAGVLGLLIVLGAVATLGALLA